MMLSRLLAKRALELTQMLHIIYRSHGGDNTKNRPDYYSKLLALTSFIRCAQRLSIGAADIFLNDGPITQDRLRIMEKWGEVVARSNLGARGSMQTALKIPALRAWRDDHLVWFSEDDYLYLPRALNGLITATKAFPDASYFALYAMFGSRMPNGDPSTDRIPRQCSESEITIVHGRPWRRTVSTTSTFGSRVKPLIEDRLTMQVAIRSGGAWDHTTCLMYQGLTPYPMSSLLNSLLDPAAKKHWLHRTGIFGARIGLNLYQAVRSRKQSSRRTLVAPDPALITHLETKYLALGTDWRSFARSTQQWINSGYCETQQDFLHSAI
ncbi:MAG: hypothetical protein ABSC06_04830 [Rhodopila sp.]